MSSAPAVAPPKALPSAVALCSRMKKAEAEQAEASHNTAINDAAPTTAQALRERVTDAAYGGLLLHPAFAIGGSPSSP